MAGIDVTDLVKFADTHEKRRFYTVTGELPTHFVSMDSETGRWHAWVLIEHPTVPGWMKWAETWSTLAQVENFIRHRLDYKRLYNVE